MKLIELCAMTQKEMKAFLGKELKKYYKTVISHDGFLYARGNMNVCLTSHMDTVYKEVPKEFECVNGVLSSPQGIGGDDRCGIYMILKLLERGYKPSIIFCEDEEIGCIGAGKFARHKDLCEEIGGDCHYIIELDRKGSEDAVFYDCDNADFTKWIIEKTGYKEKVGTCSDISTLCPATGIAGVNFSCGYYNEHRGKEEYVVLDELENTLEMVTRLLQEETKEPFEYIECDYGFGFGEGSIFQIIFNDKDGNQQETYCEGITEVEALGYFFMENPTVCFLDLVDLNERRNEYGGFYF